MGRDSIKGIGQIIALDGGEEHPLQIGEVNPTDELPAIARRTAEK